MDVAQNAVRQTVSIGWDNYMNPLVASLTAVAIHESAHVLMATALGVRVKAVGLSWRGPYIVREQGSNWQNLLISLAGPLANLATVYVTLRIGDVRLATLCLMSAAMGLYNLLPVPLSDGRRAYKLIRGGL